MEWVKDYCQEYTDRQIERLDEEYNFDEIPDGDDFVTKEKFDAITNHINERLDQIKWDTEPRSSYDDETVQSVHRLQARELNFSERLDQIENALNHITRAGVHLKKVEWPGQFSDKPATWRAFFVSCASWPTPCHAKYQSILQGVGLESICFLCV